MTDDILGIVELSDPGRMVQFLLGQHFSSQGQTPDEINLLLESIFSEEKTFSSHKLYHKCIYTIAPELIHENIENTPYIASIMRIISMLLAQLATDSFSSYSAIDILTLRALCMSTLEALAIHIANPDICFVACALIGSIMHKNPNSELFATLQDMDICDLMIEVFNRHNHLTPCISASGAIVSLLLRDNHSGGYATLLGDRGLCEAITMTLSIHTGDSFIVDCMCKIISQLIKDTPTNQERFVENDNCLLALMKATEEQLTDSSVVATVLHTVLSLCNRDDSGLYYLKKLTLAPILISIMNQHVGSVPVIVPACRIIVQICSDNERDLKEEFERAGIVEASMKILRTAHNAHFELTRECCCVVRALCKGDLAMQEHFGLAGACSLIAAAYNSLTIPRKCPIFGATLNSLCQIAANRDRIGEYNVCMYISTVLHYFLSRADFVEINCDLVAELARSDENKELLGEHGICPTISDVMNHYMKDSIIIEASSRAIVNLTDESIPNQRRFATISVCPLIIDAMQQHSSSAATVQALCEAVITLSFDCPSNKQTFGEANACEIIGKMLTKHEKNRMLCESLKLAAGCLADGNLSNYEALAHLGVFSKTGLTREKYCKEVPLVPRGG